VTVALWVLAAAVVWLATAALLAWLIGGAIRERNRQVPRDVPRDVPRRDDDRDDRGDRP
jgi:hypothetical protein